MQALLVFCGIIGRGVLLPRHQPLLLLHLVPLRLHVCRCICVCARLHFDAANGTRIAFPVQRPDGAWRRQLRPVRAQGMARLHLPAKHESKERGC